MFTPTSKAAAQEAHSSESALSKLTRTASSWYDGSIKSVEDRISLVGQVLHRASSVENPEWSALAALENEGKALRDLREAMLSGERPHVAMSRTASTEDVSLSSYGREFVATELNQFLADNQDALTNTEELTIRATNFVDLHTSSVGAEEAEGIRKVFVGKVLPHVTEPVRARTAAVRDDFDPELLFLQ